MSLMILGRVWPSASSPLLAVPSHPVLTLLQHLSAFGFRTQRFKKKQINKNKKSLTDAVVPLQHQYYHPAPSARLRTHSTFLQLLFFLMCFVLRNFLAIFCQHPHPAVLLQASSRQHGFCSARGTQVLRGL